MKCKEAQELIHDLEYFGTGLHMVMNGGLTVGRVTIDKLSDADMKIFNAKITVHMEDVTEVSHGSYTEEELLEFKNKKK